MDLRRPSTAAFVIVAAALVTFLALDSTLPAAPERQPSAPTTAPVADLATDPGTGTWRHVKLVGDRVLILDGHTRDGDAAVLKDTGLRRSDLRTARDVARLEEGIDFPNDSAVASFLQQD